MSPASPCSGAFLLSTQNYYLVLNDATLSLGMLFSQFLYVIHQSRDNLLTVEDEEEQSREKVGVGRGVRKKGFDDCWKDI